jgi:hypothetical protein
MTCDRFVVFSGAPVSSTNKTDCHDIITEILIVESGIKHHKPNQPITTLSNFSATKIYPCDYLIGLMLCTILDCMEN